MDCREAGRVDRFGCVAGTYCGLVRWYGSWEHRSTPDSSVCGGARGFDDRDSACGSGDLQEGAVDASGVPAADTKGCQASFRATERRGRGRGRDRWLLRSQDHERGADHKQGLRPFGMADPTHRLPADLTARASGTPAAPVVCPRPPLRVAIGNPLPFELPHGHAHAVTDALLNPRRTQPVSLGRVRWSGKYGQLVLAPAYPRGGEAGDHLIFSFSFSAGGVSYAITLHSWAPLVQTVAPLKRIVASAR